MQIIKNRRTKSNQLIQLTLESSGVYRVQIWTEDNLDWDWIEGEKSEMERIYELCERIEDLVQR